MARIPNGDNAAFEKAAQAAKAGCPVSKLLKAEITMTAKLEGQRAKSRTTETNDTQLQPTTSEPQNTIGI
ncbi:MAG TPA: hypothetical protein VMU57_05550 [Edaphobacter sp.]|uniref:hypothetical protein n=1 Tax=Edaphobacter sp. TaxID=1934404 RepID=UPI002C4CC10E|nr:hypothetical protein [Edaphobacter sp.]HUZ94361.1 hypothetical protein [Edaphobacter sp.]